MSTLNLKPHLVESNDAEDSSFTTSCDGSRTRENAIRNYTRTG